MRSSVRDLNKTACTLRCARTLKRSARALKESACAFERTALALGKGARALRFFLHKIATVTIRCHTDVKERPAERSLKDLQAYNKQSTAASTMTSKSFENFRRHFLKINFRYNVRFLTSTTTYTQCFCSLLIPHSK